MTPTFDLFQGLLIGLIISIPLGPIGLIIIKRTAEHGFRAGIISALAIVLVDTIGAIIIMVSLQHTTLHTFGMPSWIKYIGASAIFLYGLRMIFTDPIHVIEDELPWHKHFFSALLLALTNPATYFSFGIIGLLLTRFVGTPVVDRVEVMIGFFIGAIVWWCALTYLAFTQRDRYKSARYIHRLVGIIIMALALITALSHGHGPIVSLFFKHFL